MYAVHNTQSRKGQARCPWPTSVSLLLLSVGCVGTDATEGTHNTVTPSTPTTVGSGRSQPVPKLHNVAREQFRLHATRGSPVVVTDAVQESPDFALAGWTCDRFATEFPQAQMYSEYGHLNAVGEQAAEEVTRWIQESTGGHDEFLQLLTKLSGDASRLKPTPSEHDSGHTNAAAGTAPKATSQDKGSLDTEADLYTLANAAQQEVERIRSHRMQFDDGGIDNFPPDEFPHINGLLRRLQEIRLSDGRWSNERIGLTEDFIEARQGSTGEAPAFGPYYWDFKSTHRPQPAHVQRKLKSLLSVPYFLNPSKRNVKHIKDKVEFWFGAVNQSGALGHMDPHCEGTLSIQLAGKKRWRLSPPPFRTPTSRQQREDEDWLTDGAYTHFTSDGSRWRPTLEVVLEPGEALYFPPGYIHETMSVGNECTSSLTVQFDDPLPAAYYRAMLPTLSRTGTLSGCWPIIQAVATARALPSRLVEATWRGEYNEAHVRQTALTMATAIDTDDNGVLSLPEIKVFLKRQRGPRVTPAAVHSYHDVDGNGIVQVDEFVDGVTGWVRNEASIIQGYTRDGDEDDTDVDSDTHVAHDDL
eukprot:m.197561 g.197561  ORF g.197561 m.197561 type:complete len:584 (-) comp20166_c0_seq1:2571-4322(-)